VEVALGPLHQDVFHERAVVAVVLLTLHKTPKIAFLFTGREKSPGSLPAEPRPYLLDAMWPNVNAAESTESGIEKVVYNKPQVWLSIWAGHS
jgi:hypothetical protein